MSKIMAPRPLGCTRKEGNAVYPSILCFGVSGIDDGSSATSGAPLERTPAAKPVGQCSDFLNIPNHEYLSEYRHHWSNGNRGGNGVLGPQKGQPCPCDYSDHVLWSRWLRDTNVSQRHAGQVSENGQSSYLVLQHTLESMRIRPSVPTNGDIGWPRAE